MFSKYRQAVSYTAATMGPAPVPQGELVLVRAGLRAGGWETCHVPRRTWLDSKIDVFLEELAASGMHLDRQRAGVLITGQVRAVAALMAVTETTARSYLGDEIIKDMARRMLFEVAAERPGADLLESPRTVPLPLALVGITVAALAEAMQVRAANEPPGHLGDVITTYAQTLSGFGQITADAAPGQAGDPAEILFPPALLRRAARYISGAADLAANGGKLPDRIPETTRSQLAATLRRDADGLTALTAADLPGTPGSSPKALAAQRRLPVRATAAMSMYTGTGLARFDSSRPLPEITRQGPLREERPSSARSTGSAASWIWAREWGTRSAQLSSTRSSRSAATSPTSASTAWTSTASRRTTRCSWPDSRFPRRCAPARGLARRLWRRRAHERVGLATERSGLNSRLTGGNSGLSPAQQKGAASDGAVMLLTRPQGTGRGHQARCRRRWKAGTSAAWSAAGPAPGWP